jgi:pilus assembly protein CpaE
MDQLLLLALLVLLVFFGLIGLLFVLRRRRAAAAAEPKAARAEAKKKTTARKDGAKTVLPEQPVKEEVGSNGRPAPVSAAADAGKVAASSAAKTMPARPKSISAEKSDDVVRILIVDDNTGTRENVSRLLYFEDDLEVIGQAVNGRQGVDMAVELKPHIVLMDINMPDMDGITATREMSTKVPFSQVIIMSVQSDQHYMKQAMAAGARDFQPKPFTSEELVSCIRRVYRIGQPTYQQFEAIERAKTQQALQPALAGEQDDGLGRVIAIYSPKGGVGTSAIAANLAVAMHQASGDVILMDGDLQFGDISVHLNTKPTRTISDLIQQDQLEVDLLPDILVPHDSGLKLLLAPPQPELADIIMPNIISEVVEQLKKQFKLVLVDTGPGLSEMTLNIMEKVDQILVITVPELPSIKSTKLFLEVAEKLGFSNRVSIVINQANKPGGIKAEKIEGVLKVVQTDRIPFDPRLHFALSKGQAVCLQDRGAPSAKAISDLAEQLLERFTKAGLVEEPV